MSIYEIVKTNVTVPQAAEHYGVEVQRNGMCRCPFHDDRHPSMKLNEDYFYCFGCGAHGDVIEFTARLFGLGSRRCGARQPHLLERSAASKGKGAELRRALYDERLQGVAAVESAVAHALQRGRQGDGLQGVAGKEGLRADALHILRQQHPEQAVT